jgi:hypothetical protein
VFHVDHLDGEHGPELYRRLTALGGEGIVSKQRDAQYQSGPTRRWLKIKTEEVRERQTEAVRAQFYREIEPEAAAELERLGLRDRLFAAKPTRNVVPATGDGINPKNGKGKDQSGPPSRDRPKKREDDVARAVEATKGVVPRPQPVDHDMRKRAPKPRKTRLGPEE